MTLWARKKDFRSAFEASNFAGETDWDVEIIERTDSVVFLITPTEDVSLELEELYSSHAYSQMKGCGSKSVRLDLQDGAFEIEVERSKLPEDYSG